MSCSTKFELEKNHLKEQIEIWILNAISGAWVALGFQKLTYRIKAFQTQPKITGSYKKECSAVIVKVVIIQIKRSRIG